MCVQLGKGRIVDLSCRRLPKWLSESEAAAVTGWLLRQPLWCGTGPSLLEALMVAGLGPGLCIWADGPSLAGALWALWPAPGVSGAGGSARAAPGSGSWGGRTSCLTPLGVSRRHLRGTTLAHGETLPSIPLGCFLGTKT